MVEGKTADLIEIYNGSDAVVDLSDYALSDKLDQPEQYCFEKGCLIQPGAYALVLCTSGESTSPADSL